MRLEFGDDPENPDNQELALITAVNKDDNTVTVERALGTTAAAAHKAGDGDPFPAGAARPAGDQRDEHDPGVRADARCRRRPARRADAGAAASVEPDDLGEEHVKFNTDALTGVGRTSL